ncbi:MAG: hypothetical protein K5651_08575 [Bacteroidales bacterium]|nr:hypothetical protein [Bacteroidales bacterium]
MNKTFTLLAAAAALMAVSCAKESNAPALQEGKTIQLTLEATRGESNTKTAISMNDEYHSLESAWAAGDKIYVYSIKSGSELGTLSIDDASIVNQKTSATSQYATSYAAFTGSITLGGDDTIADKFAFVYQGSGRSLDVSSDLLTYEMGTAADVAGLNKWDVAYATGKIMGDAGSASCAVNFSNKIGFGYFTTVPVNSDSNIDLNYYSSFTLNVKTGAIQGLDGKVSVPGKAAFFMPLVPGSVNLTCDKSWNQDGSGNWGYTSSAQQNAFTAAAGNYYRLGKSGSYGPVEIRPSARVEYETLKSSVFNVSASKTVHFTQGNLQWISTDAVDATQGYWQIAPTQYSYLGAANAKGDSADSGSKLNAGSVDLFGWGEVEAPFLCSTVNADYQPSITAAETNLTTDDGADWATKFNGVSPVTLYADAGQAYPKPAGDGNYCVLTKAEWQYLFANQCWGFATVNLTNGGSVNGLVICPNSVADEAAAKDILGASAIVYKDSADQTGKTAAFSENTIDQATIDANGLLFLPAAGYRDGAGAPSNVGTNGLYWSVTSSSATYAYYVNFGTTRFDSTLSYYRCYGRSVRLASVVTE